MVRGGRPRADFDQHKDLIIKLYQDKTPWSKIEEVLLNDHGCRAKARTIMRRFKEWDLDFHRVTTTKSDDLNHHIKSYWEDRSTRPKTDEELLARLSADGFTVTLNAIIQIRKKLNLYRRWDERLGRHRPDSELGKRGRRKQKHSTVFTEAKLAPPPDAPECEDPQQESGQGVGGSPAGQSSPPHPARPPARPVRQPEQNTQLAPGLDRAMSSDADPEITSRDVQLRALLHRVAALEQHCLENGIGLPYSDPRIHMPAPGTMEFGEWHDVQ